MEGKDQFIFPNQYLGCWWPGNEEYCCNELVQDFFLFYFLLLNTQKSMCISIVFHSVSVCGRSGKLYLDFILEEDTLFVWFIG